MSLAVHTAGATTAAAAAEDDEVGNDNTPRQAWQRQGLVGEVGAIDSREGGGGRREGNKNFFYKIRKDSQIETM